LISSDGWRLHPHFGYDAVPQTGSFEVRFADGRQSRFFYFDDIPARRLTPEILTSEQALE